MIKYLINRPIAVIMAFLALFIIGVVSYRTLPVSLLPDIDIPEITIQLSGNNTSARELENSVVKTVRQQLTQVSGLKDIKCETKDGSGIIKLNFEYGTNIDYAFLEVNEKIDAAMNFLPREFERPRVIKASATDIPVFNLNITLKSDQSSFLDLSEFVETVIKRRIEQLPEIAMVDISGLQGKIISITPLKNKMELAGITQKEIEYALLSNNIEPGSMVIRDGFYEYNIKFNTILRTIDDIRNIYIRSGEKIWQLQDLAKTELQPKKEQGVILAGGKRAVSLAIIKQADENMQKMKTSLDDLISQLKHDYPELEFNITQNQTQLLDYTITNLRNDLIQGLILVCLISFIFLRDMKSSVVIGGAMIVSLVISFLFFYLFHISLNIISLSGLILALGMMIDSSIIVTDNITQYRDSGCSLEEACVKGTNEVILPILSSSLSTIAVFTPLVFLKGIAGAIFFDQAFSVTIGLFVSYLVGIGLLPVIYYSMYKGNGNQKELFPRLQKIGEKIKVFHYIEKAYDYGTTYVFNNKVKMCVLLLLIMSASTLLLYFIEKDKMPKITQTDTLIKIDWNENIHITENQNRTNELFRFINAYCDEQTAAIGQQQYLLNRNLIQGANETEIYVNTRSEKELNKLKTKVIEYKNQNYPDAKFTFHAPTNLFEKIFVSNEPDLVIELYSKTRNTDINIDTIYKIETIINSVVKKQLTPLNFVNQLNLTVDREKLLLYNASYSEIQRLLKTAFRENNFTTLRSSSQYLPVVLGDDERPISEILQNTLVKVDDEVSIPLSVFVKVSPGSDIKTIVSGRKGEYIQFVVDNFNPDSKELTQLKNKIAAASGYDVDFSGAYFSNRAMFGQLSVILLISLFLIFFILAAQFESLKLPLIVLLEIPIGIGSALLLLFLTGNSLNLMSGIGIIVTCGIIINDSILKIDAMNQLRRQGMPLLEAIHTAGHKRLRAIIMTSLTAVMALVPVFFTSDIGSELQQPFAIAIIGSMLIGTVFSLLFIPLAYWFIYRNQDSNLKHV